MQLARSPHSQYQLVPVARRNQLFSLRAPAAQTFVTQTRSAMRWKFHSPVQEGRPHRHSSGDMPLADRGAMRPAGVCKTVRHHFENWAASVERCITEQAAEHGGKGVPTAGVGRVHSSSLELQHVPSQGMTCATLCCAPSRDTLQWYFHHRMHCTSAPRRCWLWRGARRRRKQRPPSLLGHTAASLLPLPGWNAVTARSVRKRQLHGVAANCCTDVIGPL